MLTDLAAAIFRCRHSRMSFPMKRAIDARSSEGTYITCLDCGKAFHYDWVAMRIGQAVTPRPVTAHEHQLEPCAKRGVVVREV